MNALRYSPYSDSFSRPVVVSIVAHALLVGLFAVRAAWFPNEPMMIRNAIRVDIVGLPDKVEAPEIETPAPPAPPKVEAKKVEVQKPAAPKVPAPSLKTAKETQRKALEKLKAMEAIEKLKGEVSEAKSKEEMGKRPRRFAGNTPSAGNELTGLERLDFDRYFASLESQIRANWHLPGWLAQAQLRAQALVMINEQGQIIKRELLASSGNDVFDAEVLDAIDRSTFPAPPERLRDVLSLRGVVFNFPE